MINWFFFFFFVGVMYSGEYDVKKLNYIMINWFFFSFCVGVMYSGEYDVCDVILSNPPQRESLENMPDHNGNRTYPPLEY